MEVYEVEVLDSLSQFLNFTAVGLTSYLALKVASNLHLNIGKNNQTFKDYFKHIYVRGQTGTGKTTFLLNLIHEFKKYGTVIFICYKDQKTADELLNTFDNNDRDYVVYIDPTIENYKIGFSMFGDSRSNLKNELYVNSMIDIYKTLWGDAIGASSEDIFRMIGLGVAEMNPRTPLEIYKCLMLEYEDYRTEIANKTNNPIVKDFFIWEMPKKLNNHSVMNPPKNKQRRIVGSPVLLYTLCQEKPLFSLEKEINSGKVIIANFNQEKLGAENASFLASLFFSQIQIIGFTREDKSMPVFVIADEFQDYINDSFETFLSQARSFNMSLTLAHQYGSQVPRNIQAAIDGNVASKYYFRCGKEDAINLRPVLDEDIEVEDLVKLKDYYYVRDIIVKGKKQPMKIRKAPPPPKTYNNREYIIKNSIKQYGAWKGDIEKSIKKRLDLEEVNQNENKGGIEF